MFRLRSKSGDESVFRTTEEIRAALLSGFVTPDAQIWDAELKGWVPLLEHALYQQIAATPGGRKSNAVKAPPSSPTTAKPVQKLVIRRPGETATPAAPTPPPPPAPKPPAPKPPVVEEGPELEMLDIDLSMDPEPVPEAAPAPPPMPAPTPPPAAAPPPKRPTPPPAPQAAPPPPPPRVSAPRVSAPAEAPARASTPVMRSLEPESEGGSKKGLIIAAVVVLAAAGGGFAFLRGKGVEAVAVVDSSAFVAPVDSAPDSAAVLTDTTKADSTTPAPAVAVVDSAPPVAAAPVADTTPVAAAIPGVPFAPSIDRGFTSWNARPATGQPLSVAELEAVRLRYVSAQSRALEQYEAGLEAVGFTDMFDPARVGRQDRREESLEAVEAGREALQGFRRRQAAMDFAYTDTLRQALPAGADAPDLRTFGPTLRESAAQSATTDSLLTAVNEIYTLLVNSPGGFTLRGRDLFFKDAAKADQYRVLQERLTAQLGRLRTRPVAEVPPAMAAILRGIGLPR